MIDFHIVRQNQSRTCPIAILIPDDVFNVSEIIEHYVKPLKKLWRKSDPTAKPLPNILLLSVTMPEKQPGVKTKPGMGKPNVKMIWDSLGQINDMQGEFKISHILVAQSEYYKRMASTTRIEPGYGYMKPAKLVRDVPSISLKVTPVPLYTQLLYRKALKKKVRMSLEALYRSYTGKKELFAGSVIKHGRYITDVADLKL